MICTYLRLTVHDASSLLEKKILKRKMSAGIVGMTGETDRMENI